MARLVLVRALDCRLRGLLVERTVSREDCRSRGPVFESTWCRFKTWTVSFTLLCLYLLEETLKAVCLFYVVSMPGDVLNTEKGTFANCDTSVLHRIKFLVVG